MNISIRLGLIVGCALFATLAVADEVARDGRAVSDDGRAMKDGGVVVYHHFTPEDEKALVDRIEELRNEIATVEKSIDDFFDEAKVLQDQYRSVRNSVSARRNQY